MLKLNYLHAPTLLYRLGIKFYNTRVIRNKNKQIEGMQIDLVEPLTEDQRDFLYAIDTFYSRSPSKIMFLTFAQFKRDTQS